MKLIIGLLIALPALAQAHCPIALDIEGTSYCAEMNWQYSDKKVSGNLEETTTLSPYLIPMGEVPAKWMYSKIEIIIWKHGDENHTSQFINNFRVFPYMFMENGHHHSTSYNFDWNQESNSYIVSAMGLQKMKGCWNLRWTTASADDLTTSTLLTNITDYSNLTADQNTVMSNYCANIAVPENSTEGHHHNQ